MIPVIDEVLNIGATDNKVKYTLTHADGTTELVQIDLATPVTTVGTPLNKVLFDSIQYDIDFLTPVVGTYTGDGNKRNTHFANLGYLPKLVYIIGETNTSSSATNPSFGIINTTSSLSQFAFCESSSIRRKDTAGGGSSILHFTTTTNGFTFGITDSSQIASYFRPLNANGLVYTYILFK